MRFFQWALVAFFALLPLTASEYVTLKNISYYSKTEQANDQNNVFGTLFALTIDFKIFKLRAP